MCQYGCPECGLQQLVSHYVLVPAKYLVNYNASTARTWLACARPLRSRLPLANAWRPTAHLRTSRPVWLFNRRSAEVVSRLVRRLLPRLLHRVALLLPPPPPLATPLPPPRRPRRQGLVLAPALLHLATLQLVSYPSLSMAFSVPSLLPLAPSLVLPSCFERVVFLGL